MMCVWPLRPQDDSKRVVTFANRADYISFRHHTYTMPKGAKSVETQEVSGGAGGAEGVAGGGTLISACGS